MATIANTAKSCFKCHTYQKFNAYIERAFGSTFDGVFAFPPNDHFSPNTWIDVLTALCIIVTLAMISVLLAPCAFNMEHTTKKRVRACYFLLLPLHLYMSETLFNGLRDPAFRLGTWFCDMDCNTLLNIMLYYGYLTSMMQVGALYFAMQKRNVSSTDGKDSVEDEEKNQADNMAENGQVEREKMKVFIVSRLKE